MAPHTVNGLALCAGVGTIELGIRLALGAAYRTVGYVERDTFAAAVIVARMAEQAMDRAPIWDDVATFDGKPWRGKVDLVTAGFPCQPFSQAGKQAGTADDRWLWPHIYRIIDHVRPAFVFLENVPFIITRGLRHVLADLAESGFDAEWTCHGANNVGAPHTRQRLWLLAYSDSGRLASLRESAQRQRRIAHRQGGAEVATTLWPPRPDDADGWRNAHGPEPAVRGTSDGLAHRVDRLQAIGNSVVPLVAATAFIRLIERAQHGNEVMPSAH